MGKTPKKTGEGAMSKKGREIIWVECSRAIWSEGKCEVRPQKCKKKLGGDKA